MTTFERLQLRIKKDLDLDLINFRRTYAGHWQKSSGAFVWTATLKYEDGGVSTMDYGSSYSASDLLKDKRKLIVNASFDSCNPEIMPDC